MKFTVSQRAGAAVFTTNKLFGSEPAWPVSLAASSQLSEGDFQGCVGEMCANLQRGNMEAAKNKFSSEKFGEVSKAQRLQLLFSR